MAAPPAISSPRARRLGRPSYPVLVAAGLGLGLLALLPRWRMEPLQLSLPLAPSLGAAYLELAATRRLGQPHGLGLQTLQREDPGEVLQDYLAGRAPVVPLSGEEVLWICDREPQRCPQLLLVLHASSGADAVVVRRELVDLQGLRGQAVGVRPQDGSHWLLERALASAGLSLADVQLVPVPLSQMPRALGQRRLGGAVLSTPFREQTQRLGDSRGLFDSTAVPATLFELLVVDPAYALQNPRELQALLLTWHDARRWAAAHPAEATPILAWASRLSPTGFQRASAGVTSYGLGQQRWMLAAEGPVAINLAAQQRLAQRRGQLRGTAMLPQPRPDLVEAARQLQLSRSLPK